MIKTSIEKFAETIGFEVGASDDVVQSNLLNGFCAGLSDSILDDHARDLQMCYIADKLNKKSSKIITTLAEFIKHKEDES